METPDGARRAPYGLVLICPKCPPKDYFGMLKTPGNKAAPCPNCGAALIARRKIRVFDL